MLKKAYFMVIYVYHILMYLNGMDDFAIGEKVRKMSLEREEDLAPAKHKKILQLCVSL